MHQLLRYVKLATDLLVKLGFDTLTFEVCEYSLNIGSRQLNIFQLSDFSLQWDRLPIEMMLSNFWPFITCEQKVPQQKLLKSNILFWRDCDFKRMAHSLFTLSLFSIS